MDIYSRLSCARLKMREMKMSNPVFLYKCDPMLNKECTKTHCQSLCTMTTKKKYAATNKKYINVGGEFIECKDKDA